MNIQEYLVPYEILFRLNSQGNVVGCHRRDRRLLVDTSNGEVVSDKELDPVAIDSSPVMTSVLGQINASLSATLVLRDTELAETKTELENLQQTHIELQQQFLESQQQVLHAVNLNQQLLNPPEAQNGDDS
jgi:hypothetical protein